jgi:V/A-type H+-transporting ATPase subunit C
MTAALKQAVVDFYRYPPVGWDDWRYAFETARVRVFETQMLTRATLLDMANSPNFEHAAELLRASEYALPQTSAGLADVEIVLRARRSALRELFEHLCIDKPVAELFRSRDDFSNLRLAIRRLATGKLIGSDYSSEGNFPAERFAEVFEQENYAEAGLPDYMAEAAERAILAYYQDKDIRRLDYVIDAAQAQYNLRKAAAMKSVFLLGLFRMQIDLVNIRTMFRIKLTEQDFRSVFLDGGYVETERFSRGLDVGLEAIGVLFFATPYYEVVQAGAGYLASNKSFLKIEQQCDEYLTGFLKSTIQVAAGHQPIIAYLLMKENEIRTVRLILTAKKNHLDTKLILDRIS